MDTGVREMCGRFVQIDATIARLQAVADFQIRPDTYAPHRHRLESFNVSPQRVVVVIRASNGELRLDEMLWGIRPKWARDSSRNLINARSESLTEKPTFRNLLNQKIVIPAEGFYEWKKNGGTDSGTKTVKTPFYFHRTDGSPLLMAGIFQRSADPVTGEMVESFVILTTGANMMMSEYHDRMPVLVAPAQVSEWLLEETTPSLLARITLPPGNDVLITHQVSSRVNSSRTDGPDLIKEVDGPGPESSGPSLFS